jgi:hypothetical protein
LNQSKEKSAFYGSKYSSYDEKDINIDPHQAILQQQRELVKKTKETHNNSLHAYLKSNNSPNWIEWSEEVVSSHNVFNPNNESLEMDSPVISFHDMNEMNNERQCSTLENRWSISSSLFASESKDMYDKWDFDE